MMGMREPKSAEDRGHVEGAEYSLIQKLPDGGIRWIRFQPGVLGMLNIHHAEWKPGTSEDAFRGEVTA